MSAAAGGLSLLCAGHRDEKVQVEQRIYAAVRLPQLGSESESWLLAPRGQINWEMWEIFYEFFLALSNLSQKNNSSNQQQ